MAIVEATIVAGFTLRGDAITSRQMGMNLAQGYERFGTLPWEKFDEVQAKIGSALVRFPGGTESETLFSYANPFATSALSDTGQVVQLTNPDDFLTYCGSTGTKATFVLATEQLLSGGAYGMREFNYYKVDSVRSYVSWVLEKAGPGGISTFELGNEYESYMTSIEYGKVASVLGTIVDQEISGWYLRHPGVYAARPDVAVQVWGLSSGSTVSLSELSTRNQSVIAQFDASELAAITATTTHFYYTEGKFLGQANAHTYANIQTALGYSLNMMKAWDGATGRTLDTVFSEWNVQFRDAQTYGLQQVPVLLEMFSTLVAGGVDEMDIWSTMYNASSLADYKGGLQASGVLMQMLAHETVGMKVADVPVQSLDYDIHAFSNGAKSYLYVSSMADGTIQLSLNLQNHLDRYSLTSVRVIGVDASGADGVYKTLTGLAPWEEPDAPVKVTSQAPGTVLNGSVLTETLGAHETVVLELTRAPIRFGSAARDTMSGTDGQNDRIDAMASDDRIYGLAGNDSLFGGEGNDGLWGGAGADRLWGAPGMDTLWGGLGNDTLEGRIGRDTVCGGDGNDYVSGGDGDDVLYGEAGADAFVFRSGETGTDYVPDFHQWENDFFAYEGTSSVSAADFTLERRALPGFGSTAAELMIHWHGMSGPIVAVLLDNAAQSWVQAQDATTGSVFYIF